MSLEYENRTSVLGKFGEVCQGPNLDWRYKCKDEIIMNTMMVLADQLWKDLPYQAIVSDSSTINFRDPSRLEGGTSCEPSTANVTTELCDFVLPNLQPIRIGTQSRDYTEWRDRFCEKFPEFRSFSPFTVSGNRITFRQSENTPSMRTFAGEVAGELSFAIWNHLYRTFWLGDSADVDQFDGFFKIFDEGITAQGTCDTYPLVPTCIDMALYILGAAASAAGETVAPGDIVLDVTDPDRPGDAPGTNIITIHAGTDFETTLDITGMDSVDVMTAWYEFIVNEWGVEVMQWMLGVGKNQTKCIAEVAACKQACRGGDCRQLLVSDNRDQGRAERSKEFINGKFIRLFPYDDTAIPMLQSPALRQRNKIIFMPWVMEMDGDMMNSLLWVFRDQRAANNDLFRDVPAWRDYILPSGLPATDLHRLEEFREVGTAFESRAWDWLWDQDKNCFQWWNNAESLLLPQAPHLWMCLDGVDCSTVITLPCPNPGVQEAILSCAATTPNLVYNLTFDNSGGDFNSCKEGTKVWIASKSGDTNLQGTITNLNSPATSDPADIEVTLDAVGPYADCTWDGVGLDAGGKILYKNC